MYILGRLNDLDKVSDWLNFLSEHTNYLIVGMILIILVTVIIFAGLMLTDDNKKRETVVEKKVESKKYYRSLPCQGDIFITYFILSKCNLTDYLSIKGNLISSFYLKWVKKDLLKIKSVDQKDNQAIMYFDEIHNDIIEDEVEKKLYKISKEVLETYNVEFFKADDLIKHLISNNQSMVNFFKDAYEEGKKRLIAIGPRPDETKEYYKEYTLIPYIQLLKKEIVEFKNFLKDFTEIESKEFETVKVLDNYFIFANLLGLRDNLDKGWFSDKVNANMVKLSSTNMFNSINEYVHINNLYSDVELKKHKGVIIKSEKRFNKKQKNEFIR